MMSTGSPVAMPALRRSLLRLRRRGDPVGVAELAQRLLALEAPPERDVARRIAAAALGRPEGSLPERFEAAQLWPADEAAVAGERLDAAAFVVVDLETTGLAKDAAILEIGAVRVRALRRMERFTSLVRPPGRVPPFIEALTGIGDALVAAAPPTGRALRRFRRWLERSEPAPFVAHNASFDARFLSRALRDLALPAYRGPVLCTRRLGRRLLPRLGRYDLDHVCAHFGISNRARHRALGDAEATAAAWIELLALARGAHGAETVGDLLDLQERPPPKRRHRGRRGSQTPGGGGPPSARFSPRSVAST